MATLELADVGVTRRLRNIVLKYDGNFDLEAAFAVTLVKWSHTKSIVCVGAVEGGVLAYIRKEDTKAIPTNLELVDVNGSVVKPLVFRFAGRGQGVIEDTISNINAVMTNAVTNIVIRESSDKGEYSFDQICAAVKHLTREQVMLIKGRASAKHHNERSTFDETFLRIFRDILEIREVRSKSDPKVFSAYEPNMAIVPFEKLINLQSQKGTRLQEVSMQTETYDCLLYTSPSPRDRQKSRMPSSA